MTGMQSKTYGMVLLQFWRTHQMLAAANFNKPLDLQVTVPLTLNGFQYVGPYRLGKDWLYQGSTLYRDPNNLQRGCSALLSSKEIAVGAIVLNPKTNQIANIALNCFSYSEETEEGINDMRGYIGRVISKYPTSHTYLFIIGEDQVTSNGSLLSDVRSAIEKHFGNTDCIRQQELNVYQSKNGTTLEAAILPDGTMRYGVFNRP